MVLLKVVGDDGMCEGVRRRMEERKGTVGGNTYLSHEEE